MWDTRVSAVPYLDINIKNLLSQGKLWMGPICLLILVNVDKLPLTHLLGMRGVHSYRRLLRWWYMLTRSLWCYLQPSLKRKDTEIRLWKQNPCSICLFTLLFWMVSNFILQFSFEPKLGKDAHLVLRRKFSSDKWTMTCPAFNLPFCLPVVGNGGLSTCAPSKFM